MNDINENFSIRLKKALKFRKMKAAELSNKTNINKANISTYLSGKYIPKPKFLYLLAEALQVDEKWLLGYSTSMQKKEKEDYFEFIVDNDSMNPLYIINDKIFYNKINDLISGKDYIIEINDNVILRRLYIDEQGLILHSLNSKYEPIHLANNQLKNNDIKILGIVKELRRIL